MAESLYFYKLVSPYYDEQGKPIDTTLNCKLSINQIDSNFLTLKDFDIAKAELVMDTKTLVLTRNNGDKLFADLSNVTYNLNVGTEYSESGVSLTISYDGENGEKEVVINNLVTVDTLMSLVGDNVLTKVITDYTLNGDGTVWHPLGLNGVEKTGTYAPAISVIDLTTGLELPSVAKKGTRYVTKENVDDYGVLYSYHGVKKIEERVAEEGKGWRVPTKADWDALLNSIEPCEFRNHDSAKCHAELGLLAGKFLKSSCGWVGQEECTCEGTAPVTSTTQYDVNNDAFDDCGYNPEEPEEARRHPNGVDKYGMTIRPCGIGEIDNLGNAQFDGFKNEASFWSTSHVYDDVEQDIYVKVFDYNKSGVFQEAVCPDEFLSVRLVKDYDGENYFDVEYICGIPYKTILFPESQQVWLSSNFAATEGFTPIDHHPSHCAADEAEYDVENENHGRRCHKVDYLKVNGGEGINKRKAYFINEWNGRYWDKKMMSQGDTIVIHNMVIEDVEDVTKTVCWTDANEQQHCVEVTIPTVDQSNLEYRVYSDDECNQLLVNTDDAAVERLINIIVPLLENEREERIAADNAINGRIDEEIERASEAEAALDEKIDAEIERAMEAESALTDAIEAEIERAVSAETALDEKIDAEIERSVSTDEALDAKIDAETERAISSETALDEKIDAETERAAAEEARIEEKLDSEINRSIDEDILLHAEIDDEETRAEAEEARIEGLTIKPKTDKYEINLTAEDDADNLTLETRDGDETHFIRFIVNGSFGEI